ncbi:MAG: hypothetical protein PHN42_06205 [Bacilli bacterium]|nr:hypothetical protein [Bacilli bacterium]
MKKLGKVLLAIIEVLIIVYVIAITSCLLYRNKYGYTVFGDKTLIKINDNNSAELASFKKGELVIIDQVDYDEVEIGDTLYYYDTVNQSYIIKTGIVKEKSGDDSSAIYIMDDSKSIAEERIVGSYEKQKYENLGAVLDVLESRIGFLLIVILPVFVLFIYQVYKMVVLLKFSDNEQRKIEKSK